MISQFVYNPISLLDTHGPVLREGVHSNCFSSYSSLSFKIKWSDAAIKNWQAYAQAYAKILL